MKVSIIGTGYVGLVTGVCLAEKGHQVLCVDLNQEKVDNINQGSSPIYERGLEKLLQRNVNVRLKATTDLHKSVIETDISLIAVGTPFNGTEIDLTFIKEVAHQIGKALKEKSTYHLVVVKSTVVPGTTDQIVLPILEEASGKEAGIDFGVGMNPEFLTEGEAVQDFMFPDRIILGGIDGKSIDVLEQLYIVFESVDRLRTNNKTAEMIKYASNALLATMISFSNEIGNLCTAAGDIDVADVMRGVHLSKYLSPILLHGDRVVAPITEFLWAGCGFGGSCLPKDVKALIACGKKAGSSMGLLEAVMRINEQQPQQILSLLKKHFPSLKGVNIAILGLAFRPNTDDMRESPAIPIVKELLAQGAAVKAYDPAARKEAQKYFCHWNVMLCDDLSNAIEGAQALVLVTSWEEFKDIPALLIGLDPEPVLIDGRRRLDKHSISRYEGIGL